MARKIQTMTGKDRTNPATGKTVKGKTTYRLRWRYAGNGPEQCVTWTNYADVKELKRIVESRRHYVKADDPDVLDRSIVTGRKGTHAAQDAKPFGPTVGQVIDELIAQKIRDGVKDTTIASYQDGHRSGTLRAFWGDEYVSQLTTPLSEDGDQTDKARALLSHVTGELGYDPRAVMQFASSVLNFAVAKGYLGSNPIKLVKMPPRDEFEPRYLAQEEFELMLEFAPDAEIRLMMEVAWETGMRVGEICALKRDDVTVLNGKAYITVSKTVIVDKQQRLTTAPPKSGKNRTIVISVDLAERLLAPGRHPVQIFPARRNPRMLLRPECVHPRFAKARAGAQAGKTVTTPEGKIKVIRLTGKSPRFHDLRHSHASNLLGAGVDMYVVSKRLGHSSITITVDIYGHLGKAADDSVLAAIGHHRPAHALRAISDAA